MQSGWSFRKYLLLTLTLVTSALLASGVISIYYTYLENKSAVGTLNREKALAAAHLIEQRILQIEQQLAYAALPQLDPSDVELRRIEVLKVLRQVPEVTQIEVWDPSGREQMYVPRSDQYRLKSSKERLQEPALQSLKGGQRWFGPAYFDRVAPHMTIATRSRGEAPVIVAEVNLKFISDIVSRIRIGETGNAYVVDGSGNLIAHPDPGLLLRNPNLSEVPHVKAAIEKKNSAAQTMVSRDLAGTEVLFGVAFIELLGWNVFVEQPVAVVYETVYASIARNGLLMLIGVAVSALVALVLARRGVRSIRPS
jgi:hypothetical protein